MGDIVRCGDDHREIVRWLWTIMLADGIRALCRAGRWSEAPLAVELLFVAGYPIAIVLIARFRAVVRLRRVGVFLVPRPPWSPVGHCSANRSA